MVYVHPCTVQLYVAKFGVGGRQGGCIQSGDPGALSPGVTAVTAVTAGYTYNFEAARSALLEKMGCFGDTDRVSNRH